MAKRMKYRMTARRKAALKRAQIKSVMKRRQKKKHLTSTYILRGIRAGLGFATRGKGGRVSDAIEGKKSVYKRRYTDYKRRF